jgi:hypothetical protein
MEFCCKIEIKFKKKSYNDDDNDRRIRIKVKPNNKLKIKIQKPYSSTKYKSYSYYDEGSYPSVKTTKEYYINSPIYSDLIDNYDDSIYYKDTNEDSIYEDDSMENQVTVYKRRNPSFVVSSHSNPNVTRVISKPSRTVTVVKRTRTPVSSVTYSPSYARPPVYNYSSGNNNLNDSDNVTHAMIVLVVILLIILLSASGNIRI